MEFCAVAPFVLLAMGLYRGINAIAASRRIEKARSASGPRTKAAGTPSRSGSKEEPAAPIKEVSSSSITPTSIMWCNHCRMMLPAQKRLQCPRCGEPIPESDLYS